MNITDGFEAYRDKGQINPTCSGFYTQNTESPKGSRIGVANLHKKFFPMNYTLNDIPRPRILKKKKKSLETYPMFMNEYINDQTKLKPITSPRIDAWNNTSASNRISVNSGDSYYRDLHPPVSLYIPPMSYQDVKEVKAGNTLCTHQYEEKEKVYKPNTIYFSNRSKMILYTYSPIKYNVELPKQFAIKAPVLKTELYKLKTKKQAETKCEPLKFNENLKKLKEIIKDPLIYEH
ncbi:hypothetical protein SteCoe_17900 [Stentor coeruleus]|uniref:Uncharacterized protein n=1 Tax=Stentor coeruleus TaxID=5963 RepID=A0A1R2BY22_9CILI|nr:hypothetical protein SteCoe_17900 [Stentor coeruleus]